MFIEPLTISWILLGAASACAFMIGLNINSNKQEVIIENTLLYLIHNNFIRAKQVDGEWEIEELEE